MARDDEVRDVTVHDPEMVARVLEMHNQGRSTTGIHRRVRGLPEHDVVAILRMHCEAHPHGRPVRGREI